MIEQIIIFFRDHLRVLNMILAVVCKQILLDIVFRIGKKIQMICPFP